MVVVVRIFDEDVDLGKADRDRDADASRAIGDRQFAVPLRDDRRLKDADGADAGGKRGVRHLAGLDFSGIAGVLFQDAGIDASQFHLFSPGFVSSRVFLEDEIRQSAGIPAGAKAARSAGIRPAQRQRRDEPALCGGRASRACLGRFLPPRLFFASCREQVGLRREVCGEDEGGSRFAPYFACKRASVSSSRLRVASASRMRKTSITFAALRRRWTARSTSQNV